MIKIYIFEYKIILTKLFYILLLGLCALRDSNLIVKIMFYLVILFLIIFDTVTRTVKSKTLKQIRHPF